MENAIIQIITGVIGSIGFAIFFNIEKSKIPAIAVGGFASWAIYLLCFEKTNSIFISCLISAIIICIYSEVMARVMKTPANILLIPSIIPLLPGGSFYYTMNAALNMDIDTFKLKGLETVVTTFGITTGIILGVFIFTEILKPLYKINNKKTNKSNICE